MCFDHDSRPPIAPIAGGSLDAREIVLEAADGNRFAAYLARAAEPTGAGIVILPDVRGLHAYYRELALRFAEHGVDAIAIDYFGRTAGIGDRDHDFDYQPHVPQTTYDGLRADVTAAAAHLRSETGVRSLFTIGFCMGGRLAFLSAGLRAGPRGRRRVLRLADRAIPERDTRTGRRRGDPRRPDPLDLRRRGRGDRARGARRVGGCARRCRRRARDHDVRGRAALVLRSQGRGVRGAVGRCVGAHARVRPPRDGGLTMGFLKRLLGGEHGAGTRMPGPNRPPRSSSPRSRSANASFSGPTRSA